MSDLTQRKYASWLEEFLEKIDKEDPEQIMVASKNKDGTLNTGYYNCNVSDKSVFAFHILVDAVWAVILANADKVVDKAEEIREEENECE